MLQWCLTHHMKIVNSIFRTKRIHRDSWRNSNTGLWKRIDYVCTSRWVMKFVRSCRVYTKSSDPFDTDHRLLVLDLQFPTTKKLLQHRLSRQNMKQPTPKVTSHFLKMMKQCSGTLPQNLMICWQIIVVCQMLMN